MTKLIKTLFWACVWLPSRGPWKHKIFNRVIPITSPNLSAKETLILDTALALLIEAGDAGLTLRKLADCAEMRLSNVQYYFKSRDDVLVAMVARYFEDCAKDLVKLTQNSDAQTPRERVAYLIRVGLAHGQGNSDMCRAFREIWAISSRNPVIDDCLMAYYARFGDVLADFAFDADVDADARARLTSVLLPYFEGFSVTARALPLDAEAIADLLINAVLAPNIGQSE